MSVPIDTSGLAVRITAAALTPEAFTPFGTVVGNPRPGVHPSAFAARAGSLPPNAFSANQGSAIQYRRVGPVQNLYAQAPSRGAEPVMSIFVCAARELAPPSESASSSSSPPSGPGVAVSRSGDLAVRILERHPFTSQTFAPLASTASTYLVIVAPSLPPSSRDEKLPVPQGAGLPGRGLPDLSGLKAFVASGSQAVTYAAGTWHAPMVVLGEQGTSLDFVVSQFSSGVAVEDCQFAELGSQDEAVPAVIKVVVPKPRRLEKL